MGPGLHGRNRTGSVQHYQYYPVVQADAFDSQNSHGGNRRRGMAVGNARPLIRDG
jgi:hypothetical protein